jgi:propane monooxygenase reductase component
MGVDMTVNADETVLQAAFRQGITLMHGCKEGQCSSCKSVLLDGDAEHGDFSTFALSESEQQENKVLLCRLFANSDLEIELLNYDEDVLAQWIPAKKIAGTVTAIEALTHDIRKLDVALVEPMDFHAGQYADITLAAGVTRSYSMANPPSEKHTLSFIIKIYPDGAFSEQLADRVKVGDPMMLEGPFGTSFRNKKHQGPTVLVGGGSGMAPLWSILNDLAENKVREPVRLYYGARAKKDLFYLEEIAAIGAKLADFAFVPALSDTDPNDDEWSGAKGFVHEIVARDYAASGRDPTLQAYACGPPPMVEAVLPVLQKIGIDADNIHLDKFTPALR